MLNTRSDVLTQLLEGTVIDLDIPPELRAAAEVEYQYVGNWLADHADHGGLGWVVFPQGSFLLNTVVRPRGRDEYDLDCVCRRGLAPSTNPAVLKHDTGLVLGRYVTARDGEPGAPTGLDERNRCWTLGYRSRFHIDVLPAIPCSDGTPTAILIPDKKLADWCNSDPQAFANWFRLQMAHELESKKLLLAEARRTAPEAIPDSSVKTVLQLAVQVLKIHRNEHFGDALDMRPASVLVTTLAAHAYQGEGSLYDVVLDIVARMPNYVHHEGGHWTVENPVEPRENFADSWAAEPRKATLFFDWLEKLGEDLRDAGEKSGLDRVSVRLAESFGADPVKRATTRLAETYRSTRESDRLRFNTTTGALATTGAIPVRRHGFYGRAPGRPDAG